MTATAPESKSYRPRDGRVRSDVAEDSIDPCLDALDALLEDGLDRLFDADYFEAFGVRLRRLHAQVRQHYASGELNAAQPDVEVPPEFSSDLEGLRSEHSRMIGMLDRLIRPVDSMADRPLEDKEVFLLRVRELISMIRRHCAEEDRLFYLAVWRDTGGES